MNFASVLETIVSKVDGAVGALIMGVDGISVEQFTGSNHHDLEAIAAEFTFPLQKTFKTSTEAGLSTLQEMTVIGSEMSLLFRPITPEYFIIVLLEAGGNIGRARFELRKAQLMLEEEFSF